MKKIGIIGCGDIGRRIVALFQAEDKNHEVFGVVQSKSSTDACNKMGIKTYQLNLDLVDISLPTRQISHADIFYFAPPPSAGEKDTRLEKFLTCLAKAKSFPRRVVLISTTGVYGDSKGGWINESTPVNPVADRAKRRVSAEKILLAWAKENAIETMILRVPGIYAKDRLPLARLKKGLPVVKESEAGYTNRIHADDLAQACKVAMETESANNLINVTDGNPSTMTAYFNQVADYAELPRPPQINMKEAEETLSVGMVSYLKESRRIENSKMLSMFDIKLKYPDLESAFKKL